MERLGVYLQRFAASALRCLQVVAGWLRGCGPRRLLALLPLVLLAGWLLWIALDRTGVRANLEEVARDYVAFQRVAGFSEELNFAADESGVDPYLLGGILWTESSGRVGVVSSANALGLFQLRAITYEWRAELMGLPKPTRKDMLSDPLLNARIGANNVAWLLDTYDGDVERMLLAYNAGPGRLAQLEEAAGGWKALRKASRARGDSKLFAYADKVQRYAAAFREAEILDGGEPPKRPLLNQR